MPKKEKATISNPEEVQPREDPPEEDDSDLQEEDACSESNGDEADEADHQAGTLHDSTNAHPSKRRPVPSLRKPSGQAKTLHTHKAPLLVKPDRHETWQTRFLSYCYSVDTRYSQILEGRAVGNCKHEEQLFNTIQYAQVMCMKL